MATSRRSFLTAAGIGSAASLAGCMDGLGGGGDDQFVTIATGGTGGVYFAIGGGIADVWANELELDASSESTGASVENARLIDGGDVEVALMLSNAIEQALNAEGDFEEPIPLRALFGAYTNPLHVCHQGDMEVEDFTDFEGTSISIGDLGSATELIARDIFAYYDMDYDDVDAQELSFAETTDAMLDGHLDAGFYSMGLPGPAVDELTTQTDAEILNFSDEDAQGISDEFGYYIPDEIPAGTYDGQDDPITQPGAVNTCVVHEDMDEDLAYDLTTAVYENIDTLMDVHPSAGFFEEFAGQATLEYHPGAESALDDLGLL